MKFATTMEMACCLMAVLKQRRYIRSFCTTPAY